MGSPHQLPLLLLSTGLSPLELSFCFCSQAFLLLCRLPTRPGLQWPLYFLQLPCCQLRSLLQPLLSAWYHVCGCCLGEAGHLLLAQSPAEFLLLISGPQMLLLRRYFLTPLPLPSSAKDRPPEKVPLPSPSGIFPSWGISAFSC